MVKFKGVNDVDVSLCEPLLEQGDAERHSRQSKRGSQQRLWRMKNKSSMVKETVRNKSHDLGWEDLERMTHENLKASTLMRSVFSVDGSDDFRTSSLYDFSCSTSDVTEQIGNVEEETIELKKIEDEEEFPVTLMTKIKSAVVITATVAAVGTYFFALSVAYAVTVPAANLTTLGIAAGVCVVVTPWVWLNEWKLIRYPALRRIVSTLRGEIDLLKREITVLTLEVAELETEAERIQEGNARLQRITNVQDNQVEELVELLQENQEILDEWRNCLRRAAVQEVIKLVLRSDKDRDGVLNKSEAKALERMLQISMDAYGIIFDTEKFNMAVGLSPSVVNVLTIVKRLLPDENDGASSFYSVESDDDESSTSEEDDVYDMFYYPVERETTMMCPDTLRMCEEYSKIHHKSPKLMSLATRDSWRRSLRQLRCECGMIEDCSDEYST